MVCCRRQPLLPAGDVSRQHSLGVGIGDCSAVVAKGDRDPAGIFKDADAPVGLWPQWWGADGEIVAAGSFEPEELIIINRQPLPQPS